MNTPVRRIAIAVMAMVLLLFANLTYVQVVKAGDYRNDPRNQRVLLAEYSRQRGQISAEGQVLASSTETNDRLRYLRTYPDGPEYAPLTGYYSVIYGSSGMERAADAVLNGSDDRLFGRRLSDLITGRDPSGGNVVLTIDPAVQKVAYDQLTRKRYAGAVVALQPATGAVLAMASTPSFDPNRLANHNTETQKQAWADYTSAKPPVLINRGIQATYPPGSTFKLVDMAAALASGKFTEDSQVTAAPRITLQGTRTTLENYNGNACGTSPTVSLLDVWGSHGRRHPRQALPACLSCSELTDDQGRCRLITREEVDLAPSNVERLLQFYIHRTVCRSGPGRPQIRRHLLRIRPKRGPLAGAQQGQAAVRCDLRRWRRRSGRDDKMV